MVCFVMLTTIRVGTTENNMVLKEGEVYTFCNSLTPEGRKLIAAGHAKEICDLTKIHCVNIARLGAKLNARWN